MRATFQMFSNFFVRNKLSLAFENRKKNLKKKKIFFLKEYKIEIFIKFFSVIYKNKKF